jgi:hypothetical protein
VEDGRAGLLSSSSGISRASAVKAALV